MPDSCPHPDDALVRVHQYPDLGWLLCYNCGATGRVESVTGSRVRVVGGRMS